MTEHSASVFVFFFLGEYASLILMSAFMSVFFLGGHHCPDLHAVILNPLLYIYNVIIDTIVFYLSYTNATYEYYTTISWGDSIEGHSPDLFNYDIHELEQNYNIIYGILPIFNKFFSEINNINNINIIDRHPYFMDLSMDLTQFSNKDAILQTISLFIDKIQGSYILGIKIVLVVFMFIWVRASFPRFRYDQLMSLCWKELLPLVFAYIIFTICLFYTFNMMPYGVSF